MKTIKKDEKGFTIIEVLIVLAIAALILLIVFLAVPALQRNSRNNTRNNDAARISASVTECLSNRNGQTGSCDTAGEVGFNAGDYGEITTLTYSAAAPTNTTTVNYQFGRVCTADGGGSAAGTQREFTVQFQIETSGGTTNRCIGSE